eukprot:888102-Karenia_brevis.AAC.1
MWTNLEPTAAWECMDNAALYMAALFLSLTAALEPASLTLCEATRAKRTMQKDLEDVEAA